MNIYNVLKKSSLTLLYKGGDMVCGNYLFEFFMNSVGYFKNIVNGTIRIFRKIINFRLIFPPFSKGDFTDLKSNIRVICMNIYNIFRKSSLTLLYKGGDTVCGNYLFEFLICCVEYFKNIVNGIIRIFRKIINFRLMFPPFKKGDKGGFYGLKKQYLGCLHEI